MTYRGLKYPTKEAWMASPGWQDLKRRVLKQQDGGCADCGYRRGLELHHKVYPQEYMENYYDLDLDYSWGDEDEQDMAVVCRECHRRRHVDENGDFWDSPLEMEHWWAPYYWALEKDD